MGTKTNIFIFAVLIIITLKELVNKYLDNPNYFKNVKKYFTDYISRTKRGYAIFKTHLTGSKGPIIETDKLQPKDPFESGKEKDDKKDE